MSLFSLLAEVLFVGHSLVGPTLPAMVEAGLAQKDAPAVVEAQVINGASLAYNWDHSAQAEGVDGRAALASGQVGTLILTEAVPIAAHVQWSDTAGLVARWADAARAGNAAVDVWLYESWPSLNSGTPAAAADDPGGALPWRERIAEDLALWQQAAAEQARILPAGQAMGLLADEIAAGRVPGINDIRDIFVDDIHPDGKGLYFLAMVQIAALTGSSPEGLPAKLMRTWPSRDAVITEEQALAFQRIAWQAVQAFPGKREATPDPLPEQAAGKQEAAPVVPADPAPSPQWTPPERPDFAPMTNPALMLGLAGVNDWSVQQPFLDVMKTARPWVGHLPGQWGGWEEADLKAAGALDPNGWPVRLPPEITGISTLVLTDLPEDAGGVAGQYVLTWEGRGALKVEGRARVLEEGAGRMLLDYTPGDGAVILTLTAIDPADPIRNLTLVRADREAALAAGELFNPDWLARIEGVKGLRFMDWMATNNATLSTVADRPKPEDYSWARNGVPVEVMIDLSNRLRAEPWLTLPHASSDDLVRAYAAVVRERLDPGLRVWVEMSNEVWNPQFTQAQWADAMGRARWGQDATWLQFYGLRAAEIMSVFAETMGGTDRMVRVIGTQTGVKGAEVDILTAPLLVAEGGRPPAESFDAYAVTGYFSGLLGAEHKLPAVRGWIAESEADARSRAAASGLTGQDAMAFVAQHRFDLAIDRAAAELRDGASTGVPEDTLHQVLSDILPYHAGVAKRHGLKLVMYEGGTHVVGYGPAVEDNELTDFFIALNFSPQMGALYAELLSGWARLSDQPFNAFVDVYRPNKWGSWGALRHLWDDNPRWSALARGCTEC